MDIERLIEALQARGIQPQPAIGRLVGVTHFDVMRENETVEQFFAGDWRTYEVLLQLGFAQELKRLIIEGIKRHAESGLDFLVCATILESEHPSKSDLEACDRRNRSVHAITQSIDRLLENNLESAARWLERAYTDDTGFKALLEEYIPMAKILEVLQ